MNKKVLILGGSGGIGSHLVEQFAASGWETAFTYSGHNKTNWNEDKKGHIHPYKANVESENDIMHLVTEIKSDLVGLDALVYAVGIFEDALTDNMQLESWNHVISVNLTGAFLTTKYFLPMLRESGNGRILYIGSVMGEAGCYGSSSYSVTKAGLIALAKSVALENAKKNVTANVLSFGYIDTGMTTEVPEVVLDSAMKRIPMKRLGNPSDAAKIAVDLCSEYTNYISGQTIRVNGGLYV